MVDDAEALAAGDKHWAFGNT
eukprot:COSAG01_NODE_65688_length_272_cov_1.150289_1_plen_20_part_10